jgi:hypothetical protein
VNHTKYTEMVRYERLVEEAINLCGKLVEKHNLSILSNGLMGRAMKRWDRREKRFQQLVKDYYGGGK